MMIRKLFWLHFLLLVVVVGNIEAKLSMTNVSASFRISSSSSVKPVPKFTTDTLAKAENIILFDNAPLNTEILRVQATTYDAAMPIRYSLIDESSLFNIDSLTGSVVLFNPINRIGNYKFIIVAYDSAPYPDTQSSFLTANVAIITSINYAPAFNDYLPYYVSILDIINPDSIIYDEIIVNDNNYGQNGGLTIFCDPKDTENLDASQSCNYFRAEFQMIEIGTYKVLIRLIKKLDYNMKRSFIMTITAQIFGPITLSSSTHVLIEIKSTLFDKPSFVNSTYFLELDVNTKPNANVLKVAVTNVNNLLNGVFELSDPLNNFILSNTTKLCQLNYCEQHLQLKSNLDQPTQYFLKVKFKQNSANSILKDEATVNVVIKRPRVSQSPPIFINTSYEFRISENLKPDEIARSVSITVIELDKLSVYSAGFNLELLNSDLSLSNDVFEIVPNFGVGLLVSSLRLKKNVKLDFENGKQQYDYIIRAISRSSKSLVSYAKLTIFIQDYNEFSPIFQYPSYTAVLNNPESYQKGDVLVQVKAIDYDSNGLIDLTYSVNGPFKDRFQINKLGQVSLIKPFDLSKDDPLFYNVSLTVYDQDGLNGFTSLIVYLNVTSAKNYLKNSVFECSIYGIRSELNHSDRCSFSPPLFIQVNSIFPLKYFLIESIPSVPGIIVDENTGEVKLNAPLNDSVITNYDRIIINVKIYQVQPYYTTNNLYLSSIICSATIYLKQFSNFNILQQKPLFMNQYYSITIDRESIYKVKPLVKVDAISMNPKNLLPVVYGIIGNNDNDLFVIDTIQGYIYPRHDLGLAPRAYTLQVKATDQTNFFFSIVNVTITVVLKSNDNLKCDTDYLIIRLNSYDLLFNSNNPIIFGQLICSYNSVFNDSSIYYQISSSIATFDCKGNSIEYTPKIGIDSSNGNLASFETLSTEKFCDASFVITVRQDDLAVLVPFKLILIRTIQSIAPVFVNLNANINYLPSFAYVNFQVTTVIAYDPISQLVVENYTINSEIASSLYADEKIFKIDTKSGIISLNTLPLVDRVQLVIIATSTNGLSSNVTINVDFKSFRQNYYPSLMFDPSLPNAVSIYDGNVYDQPIYEANLICYAMTQSSQCGSNKVFYELNYILNNNSQTSFIVDQYSANIYLISSSLINRSVQSKYLIIINATNQNAESFLSRNVNNVQKNITLTIEPFIQDAPVFDFSTYNTQIMDNTQIGQIILTMKYKSNSDLPINYDFDQQSNPQIINYFGLNYSPILKIIYLYVKQSPLPIDKPDLSFVIRISNKNSPLSSVASVYIKLLSSYNYFFSTYPSFISPINASYILVLNSASLANNTLIFRLATSNPLGNSLVVYNILNKDTNNLFYIDSSNLNIVYPIVPQFPPPKRFSYLLFIEARDLTNPVLGSTYTTLDIRLNNLIDIYPYFIRDPSSGRLSIDVYDTTRINTMVFDFSSLVYKPMLDVQPYTYYYVYNNFEPYSLSDTFYVDSSTNSLVLAKSLNASTRNMYELFIYVTYSPTQSLFFYKPIYTNIALIYLDVRVFGTITVANLPYFIEFPDYMLIEERMPLNYKIGNVIASYALNLITYSFESCDYVVNSVVFKDQSYCSLFRIDKTSGLIYTNASTYTSYMNGYFVLRVSASNCLNTSLRTVIDLKVLTVNYQEKSRLVFNRISSILDNRFLTNLSSQINQLLDNFKKNKYYFKYFDFTVPFSSQINSELDACFYLINRQSNRNEDFINTKRIFSKIKQFNQLFEQFTITNIERCFDRQEQSNYQGEVYGYDGNYILSKLSIGLITLSAVTMAITFFSILMLILCWLSHMRQALLAPNDETEIFETRSNNLLID